MGERFPRIACAYLAASSATGVTFVTATLLIAVLLDGWPDASAGAGEYALVIFRAGGLLSIAIGIVAFLPAMVAIAMGEARGWRSAWFYSDAGVVTAVSALGLMMALNRESAAQSTFGWQTVLPMSVAGLVAGLIYWLIAGRTAGDGRIPQRARP